MEFIHQPAAANRLGEFLLENLRKEWPTFRAAIAFVKRSGTKHIINDLSEFSKRALSEVIVGINHRGTSKEGLEDLLEGVGAKGRVIVFNNPRAFTFHPKIYVFQSNAAAEVLIGSGNMTEGGIFTNYEASVRLRLDLKDATHASFLKQIEDVLDAWTDASTGSARILNEDFLTKLVARGDVPIEALAVKDSESAGAIDRTEDDIAEPGEPLFTGHSIPRAPSRGSATRITLVGSTTTASAAISPVATAASGSTTSPVATVSNLGNRGFVMVLQTTDVGTGQTTPGTSPRSPEIFIPLKARDADPDFWGWDSKFLETEKQWDRENVIMRLGGAQDIVVNMMCWKPKRDFRLRNGLLRSAGSVGDILRIEKAPSGNSFEYSVQIEKQGSTMHPIYLALCTQNVRNSEKTFGYY
jgi:HKD family nuclease